MRTDSRTSTSCWRIIMPKPRRRTRRSPISPVLPGRLPVGMRWWKPRPPCTKRCAMSSTSQTRRGTVAVSIWCCAWRACSPRWGACRRPSISSSGSRHAWSGSRSRGSLVPIISVWAIRRVIWATMHARPSPGSVRWQRPRSVGIPARRAARISCCPWKGCGLGTVGKASPMASRPQRSWSRQGIRGGSVWPIVPSGSITRVSGSSACLGSVYPGLGARRHLGRCAAPEHGRRGQRVHLCAAG